MNCVSARSRTPRRPSAVGDSGPRGRLYPAEAAVLRSCIGSKCDEVGAVRAPPLKFAHRRPSARLTLPCRDRTVETTFATRRAPDSIGDVVETPTPAYSACSASPSAASLNAVFVFFRMHRSASLIRSISTGGLKRVTTQPKTTTRKASDCHLAPGRLMGMCLMGGHGDRTPVPRNGG